MTGALEGMVVVALEQAVAVPLATARLADAGARVIKLERAEGDFARGYDSFVHGQSSYFVWLNRGKESCVVDLKQPDDLRFVEAMLASADVFIQNSAPGAAARLGLGSDALRARHPRLITCDVSGFAPGTPDYQRKAYDLLIQAESGLAALTGSAESGPTRVGISIGDIATGQACYAAILEALLRRGRTGEGSHITVSLFDTLAEYLNAPYLAYRYGGKEPPRIGLAHPSIAPYGVFSASDGEVLIAIQNEREWAAFCDGVLGDAGLATDSRFARNTLRVENRGQLDQMVQDRLGRSSVNEICARLDEVKIAYGRISTMADLARHASIATATVATPGGEIELLAPAPVVNGERRVAARVPAVG